MTVTYTQPATSQCLISSENAKFLPTKIPAPHHQLKHYLSTRCKDYLYYATGYDIFCLHLPTHKRCLVKTLKWKPHCLDAALDWICAGGQHKGQCAFIEIRRDRADRSSSSFRNAEVDELLPLDLDPESRALLNPSLPSSQPAFHPPKYICHEVQAGEEIVNSVVIHRLPGGKEGLEDENVAILTNNDKTVSVFSLARQEKLPSPAEYPTYMNHASISPDGNILLAVGDQPQAFFHRRVFEKISHKDQSSWTFRWEPISSLKLSLVHDRDCCFTTGFSPSGHVCAVASQTGVATVFDTNLVQECMDDDDAVVGIFRSSRPNIHTYRGAFRSMSFSPSPWDLLALAEDQGRIMVIDLRNSLQAAEIISLEPSSKDLMTVGMQDQENLFDQRQADIERRFLESHDEALNARNHLAAVTNTADFMEYAADQRRRDREMLNTQLEILRSGSGDPHRLTENERLLLDAVSDRRLPGSGDEGLGPVSVNYPSGSNRFFPSMSSWESLNQTSTGPSRSIAEYVRLRNSDRTRVGAERLYQPRRRSSIVVAQSTNQSSANPSSLAPVTTRSSNLSASPSRLPTTTDTTDSSGLSFDQPSQGTSGSTLNITRNELRRLGATVSGLNRAQSGDSDLENQPIESLRSLQARTEQQRDMMVQRMLLQQQNQRLSLQRRNAQRVDDEPEDSINVYAARNDPSDGVVTMGVGWSADGRELFAATEEGIFQYKVNMRQRSQFPSKCWL